jgi:hypothetical protein
MPVTFQGSGSKVVQGDRAAFNGDQGGGVVNDGSGQEQFVATILIDEPARRVDVQGARPGVAAEESPVDFLGGCPPWAAGWGAAWQGSENRSRMRQAAKVSRWRSMMEHTRSIRAGIR